MYIYFIYIYINNIYIYTNIYENTLIAHIKLCVV